MKWLLFLFLLAMAVDTPASAAPAQLATLTADDATDVQLLDTVQLTKKSVDYAGKIIRLRFTHRQDGVVAPNHGWFEMEVASGNPNDYYNYNSFVKCCLPKEAASLVGHIETWDEWVKRPMTGKITTIYAYIDDQGVAWGLGRDIQRDDFNGKATFVW